MHVSYPLTLAAKPPLLLVILKAETLGRSHGRTGIGKPEQVLLLE
jgi:hypothetical protein